MRTVRRWEDRFEADGAEGLYDRRLGKLANNRVPTDTVMEMLIVRQQGLHAKAFPRETNRKLRDPLRRGANAAAQIYGRLRLSPIWAAALSTEADKENLTQVGRALQQLGIELIPAYSPQARGRSERMFGTFQNRLPQELRSHGITTMQEANRFLKEVYLPEHNGLFTKEPEDTASAFVPFTGHLQAMCAIQEERVVGMRCAQIAANRHRHVKRRSGSRLS